jgi:hypothetical protein
MGEYLININMMAWSDPEKKNNFGVRGGEGQGFSRRRKKVAKIPRGYKFEQKWRSHLAILQRSNIAT